MIQIRYGCFETNSSSTHTLVMCNEREYRDFLQNKILIRGWNSSGKGLFITYDEALADLKKDYEKCPMHYLREHGVESLETCDENTILNILAEEDIALSYEHYGDGYEFYDESYTTPGNEVVHAFGYYGYDS